MIKVNAQKLLLALYPTGQNGEMRLERAVLEELSALTPSGFRSVLYSLEQRELLLSTKLDRTYLEVTNLGAQTLREIFPALSDETNSWDGKYTGILFRDAPDSDKNFRRLRVRLLGVSAQQLSRGVYILPGKLPHSIQKELSALYKTNVAVVELGEWRFGSNPAAMLVRKNTEELYTLYSSISTRSFDLLSTVRAKKGLTSKQKEQLFSDYSLFWENLGLDLGYLPYLYPGKLNALEVLRQFQDVFSLIHI